MHKYKPDGAIVVAVQTKQQIIKLTKLLTHFRLNSVGYLEYQTL